MNCIRSPCCTDKGKILKQFSNSRCCWELIVAVIMFVCSTSLCSRHVSLTDKSENFKHFANLSKLFLTFSVSPTRTHRSIAEWGGGSL